MVTILIVHAEWTNFPFYTDLFQLERAVLERERERKRERESDVMNNNSQCTTDLKYKWLVIYLAFSFSNLCIYGIALFASLFVLAIVTRYFSLFLVL